MTVDVPGYAKITLAGRVNEIYLPGQEVYLLNSKCILCKYIAKDSWTSFSYPILILTKLGAFLQVISCLLLELVNSRNESTEVIVDYKGLFNLMLHDVT